MHRKILDRDIGLMGNGRPLPDGEYLGVECFCWGAGVDRF